MDEIKKLSNVQYVITDEVISRKWAEVYSKRNTLLLASDWTQLVDSDLPQNVKTMWMRWRRKVREVGRDNIANPDKALHRLKSLEKQSPKGLSVGTSIKIPESAPLVEVADSEDSQNINNYINSIINEKIIPKLISPQDVITIVQQELNKSVDLILKNIQSIIEQKLFNSSKIVLSANIEDAKSELITIINSKCNAELPPYNALLFEEALEYMVDHTTKVNLLSIYSKHYNKSLEDTAKSLLDLKKDSYRTTCMVEEKRLNYLSKVNDAVTSEELHHILNEFINGH